MQRETSWAKVMGNSTLVVIGSLVLLIILLMNAGCYTSKWGVRKVDKIYRHRPVALAQGCLLYFPPKDSVVQSVEYREGIPYEVPGPTLYVDCDSVVNSIPSGVRRVAVPCPPSFVRVDTARIVDSVFRISGAQLYLYQDSIKQSGKKIQDLEQRVDTITKKRDKWRKWCLVLGGLLILCAIAGIWKLYTKAKTITVNKTM